MHTVRHLSLVELVDVDGLLVRRYAFDARSLEEHLVLLLSFVHELGDTMRALGGRGLDEVDRDVVIVL